MTNTIINALVAGLLGAIAIAVSMKIIMGQDTSGWDTATITMFILIPTVIGIVVIVGLFMLLTKVRGAA